MGRIQTAINAQVHTWYLSIVVHHRIIWAYKKLKSTKPKRWRDFKPPSIPSLRDMMMAVVVAVVFEVVMRVMVMVVINWHIDDWCWQLTSTPTRQLDFFFQIKWWHNPTHPALWCHRSTAELGKDKHEAPRRDTWGHFFYFECFSYWSMIIINILFYFIWKQVKTRLEEFSYSEDRYRALLAIRQNWAFCLKCYSSIRDKNKPLRMLRYSERAGVWGQS